MPISISKRLKLMAEIAHRLGVENYTLIDVTLSAFGARTANTWNGTIEEYVFSMLQDMQAAALIDLARHVGISIESDQPSRVDPPFWQNGMLRLFISHLSANRGFAAELQEELLAFGISGFVAHNDIEPTLEWLAQIETALATCDTLIALLHIDFHKSKWTDQEIGFAMGRGVPTFSVQLGETPYGFIGRFQAFNGNGKSAGDLARELFDSYRSNKQTEPRMAEVLIAMFENSSSFRNAKSRMSYVEELNHWDPSFTARLRSAVANNGQISGSWGIAERVEAVIARHEQAA